MRCPVFGIGGRERCAETSAAVSQEYRSTAVGQPSSREVRQPCSTAARRRSRAALIIGARVAIYRRGGGPRAGIYLSVDGGGGGTFGDLIIRAGLGSQVANYRRLVRNISSAPVREMLIILLARRARGGTEPLLVAGYISSALGNAPGAPTRAERAGSVPTQAPHKPTQLPRWPWRFRPGLVAFVTWRIPHSIPLYMPGMSRAFDLRNAPRLLLSAFLGALWTGGAVFARFAVGIVCSFASGVRSSFCAVARFPALVSCGVRLRTVRCCEVRRASLRAVHLLAAGRCPSAVSR